MNSPSGSNRPRDRKQRGTSRWNQACRRSAEVLPNHPNFRGISRTFDGTTAGELTSALPGRQIQFALKLLF